MFREESQPRYADAHLVRTERGGHLFVVDRSQFFDLDEETFAEALATSSDTEMWALLRSLGLAADAPSIADQPPARTPVRALSLAVAQKCNLGCTYCYAQDGAFGSAPKSMSLETAKASVDLLLAETKPDQRINIAFLGGEPLANRTVLRQTTEYASFLARARGQSIGFSITTNGTLVEPEDAAFFEKYGFAVTVSIDGPGAEHDRLRPFKNGRGSYQRVIERVRHLLREKRVMQVSARVTVTPANLGLRSTLDELLDLGFESVGFSPMLASPSRRDELDGPALERMLAAMIECGQRFVDKAARRETYAFSNMITALQEIHRGSHRPYPCGAGGGYLGVSAEGELAACHRFVGDDQGRMGSLAAGVDRLRQAEWLSARHVHRQPECRSCWARYLCGGGCHHEVLARGRPSCDFIRGWLHYVLQSYVRLTSAGLSQSFGVRPA